jgi:hypothetical protein
LSWPQAAPIRESDLGRVRSLLNPPVLERRVEWEAVFRLADHHGTSSLLYQNLARLGGIVPPSELASARQSYERNVHRSLFLAREMIRILDRLDAWGIEAIPCKGIVLSEVYYADMALRQSGDMDLFVRRHDVARIQSACGSWDTRCAYPFLKRLRKTSSLRDTNVRSTALLDATCSSCSGRSNRSSTRSTSTWMDCSSVR